MQELGIFFIVFGAVSHIVVTVQLLTTLREKNAEIAELKQQIAEMEAEKPKYAITE